MHIDWAPVQLSIRLALVTTATLLVIGLPIAWWLATTRRWWRGLVEALVALPLVLPPTVLGFYLLVLLADDGPIGSLWRLLGGDSLVFSFRGLVLGSILYSLPFVVQPLQNAMTATGRAPLEAAATLGAGPIDRFFRVLLPQIREGLLTATVLGFAHTLGEFGVVLMIGGNIPGRTQVLSIAIYDHVEALDYATAHWLSGGLLVASFGTILFLYARRRPGLSLHP